MRFFWVLAALTLFSLKFSTLPSIIRLGLDKAGARIVFKTPCAISFDDPSVAAEAFQLPFDESGGRQADTLQKRSPRMMIRTHASSAESKTPE